MAEATDSGEIEQDSGKKRGIKGILFGVVGALILGGGGFYAASSGMLDFGSSAPATALPEGVAHELAFVPMDPITISLPPGNSARMLRFAGQLEVSNQYVEEVIQLMPRIVDVLNTYLRAVEVRDLEQPASLSRLRAQMLRRVQVVTGEGRVRDLLIAEFILN